MTGPVVTNRTLQCICDTLYVTRIHFTVIHPQRISEYRAEAGVVILGSIIHRVIYFKYNDNAQDVSIIIRIDANSTQPGSQSASYTVEDALYGQLWIAGLWRRVYGYRYIVTGDNKISNY